MFWMKKIKESNKMKLKDAKTNDVVKIQHMDHRNPFHRHIVLNEHHQRAYGPNTFDVDLGNTQFWSPDTDVELITNLRTLLREDEE